MAIWLEITRGVAVVNVLLLLVLSFIWFRNYRQHGADHTLALLVFAVFLLVENGLWVFFYLVHSGFIGWFVNAGTDVQIGMTMLCGLELGALAILTRITVR
ncbi:hypothetical protein [Halorubrum salsamenti]|uniref:hypothetical protein n=1 Tax=Halorubrum salsamenti TaxID=2583990 RepID=UPI00119FB4C0|nr:hypothetical protein [Halorubrum salsamenti]